MQSQHNCCDQMWFSKNDSGMKNALGVNRYSVLLAYFLPSSAEAKLSANPNILEHGWSRGPDADKRPCLCL